MAEPDNPVDFLRNRRAAAATGGGSNGAPQAGAPPPAAAPAEAQEETFENPTHPAGGASSLEDMEPGDLLSGVPGRADMYEAEKPANGANGGGDGDAVIGGDAPIKPSSGSSLPKMILMAVAIALVVGFVVVMSKGADAPPAEVTTEPVAEPVPGLSVVSLEITGGGKARLMKFL